MAETFEYDVLVIGAGAAGSTAAETAARQGARVALVERDQLGGTCLNYGCDPTKTLLHIAGLCHHAKKGADVGLHIPTVQVEWEGVLAQVQEVVARIRGGTVEEAATRLAAQGIAVLWGEARFEDAHHVAVGARVVSAAQVVVATGAAPIAPPIEGLAEVGYITNREAVALPTLPRRLAIIGAGPLGLEFAQLFNRFGVAVTVLEQNPTALDKDEPVLARKLCDMLAAEGVRLELGAEVERIWPDEAGKALRFRRGEGAPQTLMVDTLLLATGRRPLIEPLNLAAAGVTVEDGRIKADKTLRTNVAHIWVAGDVATTHQFTHVANEQGGLAGENALAENPRPFEPGPIPWVTYTDPGLAHVGQTEAQLAEAGQAYRALCLDLREVDRARIMGETEGMVKLLVSPEGMLLGGHILAPNAGDLLAPLVLMMKANVPVGVLAETLLPYPTLTQALRWAAQK